MQAKPIEIEMCYALNIRLRSDAHFRVLRNKTHITTALHNPYLHINRVYITLQEVHVAFVAWLLMRQGRKERGQPVWI